MNISGRLYNRLGPRTLVMIGLVMMTVTAWQLSYLIVNTSPLTITLLASLLVLSMGFCFIPITTASYNTVPQAKIPRATALSNGMMRIFASFITAFLSTLLSSRTIFHYNHLASSVTSDCPAVENLFATLHPICSPAASPPSSSSSATSMA